jgi:hypothetical protein
MVMGVLVFLIGYNTGMRMGIEDPGRGFRLPPGDREAGIAAFGELGCMQCHSVHNSREFPLPEEPQAWHVTLGGTVGRVKTYGELVTAIIHPSASIRPDVRETLVDSEGRSIMPDLTRKMTTRQMIDLATYLQGEYKVVLPEYPSNYYPYGMEVYP